MLSLDEYYPWKRDIEVRYPWERQFLNVQFMKQEKQRMKNLSKWYKKIFVKTEVGKSIQDVSFYTIPTELTSSWKAAIAEAGEYNYIGLSALYNSPQILLLALFPQDKPYPLDYRLIHIEEAKKAVIYNRRLNLLQPCLIIDKWDYFPPEYLYVDVPYEKKIISKFIEENLIHDENIALSFGCPVMSAPYGAGLLGGIAFSSIYSVAPFAKELINTIQLILPPEYRDRNLSIPKSLIKGYDFDYIRGIKFHFAEKPPYSNSNLVKGVWSNHYERIKKEILNRCKFNGEYSIFSALSPVEGNISQMWKELLKNYTLTEITLPYDLNDLIEADVDVKKMRREINEDLWIQIVYARQLKPAISPESNLEKLIMRIARDFDTLLADVHKGTEREYLVRSMLHQIKYNVKRIAQSLSRSDEKDIVGLSYLEKARGLVVDNFHEFLNHPKIKKLTEKIKMRKRDARFSVVETELINHPRSTTAEIFEAVKEEGLFRDIYDLQKLLNWLHTHAYVISDAKNRYTWVRIV